MTTQEKIETLVTKYRKGQKERANPALSAQRRKELNDNQIKLVYEIAALEGIQKPFTCN